MKSRTDRGALLVWRPLAVGLLLIASLYVLAGSLSARWGAQARESAQNKRMLKVVRGECAELARRLERLQAQGLSARLETKVVCMDDLDGWVTAKPLKGWQVLFDQDYAGAEPGLCWATRRLLAGYFARAGAETEAFKPIVGKKRLEIGIMVARNATNAVVRIGVDDCTGVKPVLVMNGYILADDLERELRAGVVGQVLGWANAGGRPASLR